MTAHDDPYANNSLDDETLDELLAATDAELLHQVERHADPTRVLNTLMAADEDAHGRDRATRPVSDHRGFRPVKWTESISRSATETGQVAGVHRRRRMVALSAAAAVALIAVTPLASRWLWVGEVDESLQPPTSTASGTTSPPPTTGGPGKTPVVGRVTDRQARLSYAQLGGTWGTTTFPPGNSGGFTKGEDSHVMENYQTGQPYLATAYSGVLPAKVDTSTLAAAAKGFFGLLEPTSYPGHTKQQMESRSYQVSGKKAWLYKLQLDYPQAQSKGWNFTFEIATVVVIDRGSGRPSTFYVSVPSSHPNLGDTDLLLSSLKAS